MLPMASPQFEQYRAGEDPATAVMTATCLLVDEDELCDDEHAVGSDHDDLACQKHIEYKI